MTARMQYQRGLSAHARAKNSGAGAGVCQLFRRFRRQKYSGVGSTQRPSVPDL